MPTLPPPGRENFASFPQRSSLTSETSTFFDLNSLKVAARSSHIRKSSCWSFSSESWNAASRGGMAKINHPWPTSTDGYLKTSRKKARSASAFLEWITICAPLIIGCVEENHHLGSLGGGRGRPPPHLLFRLHGLRDHDLPLEVLHHIRIKPHFRRLPRQRHGVNLVLQLEQRVKKIFRTRGASRDINICRDDLVDALQHRIRIKRPADRRARAHRDYPFWIRHLVVDAFHHRRHLQSHGAGHNHQIALPRAGTKHFRPEASNIKPRRRRSDHLDRAAGQTKRHRPHCRLARPVENVVNRADHEILFELVLQPAHGLPSFDPREALHRQSR